MDIFCDLIACVIQNQKVYSSYMKMGLKYPLSVIIVLTFWVGIIWAQNYPVITRIEPSAGNIKLYLDWGGGSGKDIYKVYRTIGSSTIYVGDVLQGSSYYNDNKDLYKTDDQVFSYQIIGPKSQSNIMNVVYGGTSSTARRTWGSIKAMFR